MSSIASSVRDWDVVTELLSYYFKWRLADAVKKSCRKDRFTLALPRSSDVVYWFLRVFLVYKLLACDLW